MYGQEKNIAYIGFAAIHGFRDLLGVLECLPMDKGGLL
jgi:hypothetical protein